MSIVTWILVGLVVGWLAGVVVKGSGYGMVGDIVIGILGAIIGGFLASTLFGAAAPVDGFNVTSLFTALVGAVILILVVRALPGRSPV